MPIPTNQHEVVKDVNRLLGATGAPNGGSVAEELLGVNDATFAEYKRRSQVSRSIVADVEPMREQRKSAEAELANEVNESLVTPATIGDVLAHAGQDPHSARTDEMIAGLGADGIGHFTELVETILGNAKRIRVGLVKDDTLSANEASETAATNIDDDMVDGLRKVQADSSVVHVAEDHYAADGGSIVFTRQYSATPDQLRSLFWCGP